MDIIKAEFHRTSSVPLDYLLGATGVYVLWSPRAVRAPSYIGEGHAVKRIVEHVDRFGSNLSGVVAVLHEGTARQRKRNAELLEATLLDCAADLGISPPHNQAGGKFKRLIEKIEQGHGVVRFRLSGYHPLRWDTRMNREHIVEWRFKMSARDPEFHLRHPWRRS